jgi:hypothetical protein
MLLAAAMLRRGDEIDQVEAISDVPHALLDLMRAELTGTGSGRRRCGSGTAAQVHIGQDRRRHVSDPARDRGVALLMPSHPKITVP